MHPDYEQARTFLEALTGEPDPVVLFASFHDQIKGKGARHFHGTLTAMWNVLVKENLAGRGIFVTIGQTKGDRRQAEDIVKLRAVYIDNDAAFAPDPVGCHLPPSIMVNSGNGRHTYWLLKEDQPLSGFSSVQRRLIAQYGTDKSVHDLPRVMRLPGFLHCKQDPPRPVTWYDVDPSNQAFYSLEEIAQGLPQDPTPDRAVSTYKLPDAGTRKITAQDISKLRKGKVPSWAAEILEAAIEGNAPLVDPNRHAGKVDATVTRFLAWLVSKLPDASAPSLTELLAPSWLMLSAADSAAGRATYGLDDLSRKVESAIRFVHDTRTEEVEEHPWLEYVARDTEGFIIPSRSNVEIVLRHHPKWKGTVSFDERARRFIYTRSAPWIGSVWAPASGGTEGPPGAEGQIISEHHAGLVAHWFAAAEHLHLARLPTTVIHESLEAVAMESSFDPFKDWLLSQTWDGVPRLTDWLWTYLGAVPDEWTRAVGPRWLMAAVARTLYPGCKADEMLVLQGSQGVRKSSALRALAGPEYFTDSLPKAGSDPTDIATALVGPVIVEIPEVDGINRKADATEVKAFLSKQTDRYRPKYGRREIEVPRRCVFAGSTNKLDFLVDTTGGRRFWPVAVGITRPTMDVDGLERDRGQLWAEALLFVRLGLPWHLPEGEAEIARERAEVLTESDTWLPLIRAYLEGEPNPVGNALGLPESVCTPKTQTSIEDILSRVLEIPSGKWHGNEGRRVGQILRDLGFERVKSHGRMIWRKSGSI